MTDRLRISGTPVITEDESTGEVTVDVDVTTTERLSTNEWFLQPNGGDESALNDLLTRSSQGDYLRLGHDGISDIDDIIITATVTSDHRHWVGNYRTSFWLDDGVDDVLLDAYGAAANYEGLQLSGNKANQTASNPVLRLNGIDEELDGVWVRDSKGTGCLKRRGFGSEIAHSFFENHDGWAFEVEHDGTGNNPSALYIHDSKFNNSDGAIRLAGGSWDNRVNFNQIRNSSAASNPTVHSLAVDTVFHGNEVLANGSDDRAFLIDGGRNEIIGGFIEGEVEFASANRHRIVGSIIRNSGSSGVVTGQDYTTISGVTIENPTGSGIETTIADGSRISGTVVTGAGDYGLRDFQSQNLAVVGNVFVSCAANVAQIIRLNQSTGLQFCNNIIHQPSGAGSVDGIWLSGLTDSRVEDNIIYGPDISSALNDQGGHTDTIIRNNRLLNTVGTTAERPSSPPTGFEYFDTDLGQPIWYDGTGWVDATGTTA